jgi:hypothetical protein
MKMLVAVVVMFFAIILTTFCVIAQQKDELLSVDPQWQPRQEPQSWLPKDVRQGTNITEPQGQAQSQQQNPGDVSPLLNTKPAAGTSQNHGDQHNESSYPQGETVYLSYWLTGLTFLQAVIIFFQTKYTKRAADAATESA